jgi:hypothetical protein
MHQVQNPLLRVAGAGASIRSLRLRNNLAGTIRSMNRCLTWSRYRSRFGCGRQGNPTPFAARLRKLVAVQDGSTVRALWHGKGRPSALPGVGYASPRVGAALVHSVGNGSLNKSVEQTNRGEGPVRFVAVRAPLFAVHVQRWASESRSRIALA